MSDSTWCWNPKVKGSGIIECIPQAGRCPVGCDDCFFQSGRSYLEPLTENLPHVPSPEMATGRVVRMNDGNDSNVERELVESTAMQYEDYFFNTSINKDLESFPGPVVLTVNPGSITDIGFHKVEKAIHNLMFVRVRVNAWNVESVVDHAVDYYTDLGIPVVLTFMAYYGMTIPNDHEHKYVWKKRTTNSYWVLKNLWMDEIESRYSTRLTVYTCGRRGQYACFLCGNCLREYYATKERLRAAF